MAVSNANLQRKLWHLTPAEKVEISELLPFVDMAIKNVISVNLHINETTFKKMQDNLWVVENSQSWISFQMIKDECLCRISVIMTRDIVDGLSRLLNTEPGKFGE